MSAPGFVEAIVIISATWPQAGLAELGD